MSMVPDASTAWIDPFYKHKTLSMICSIQEPRSGEPYDRCPRALAQKALKYLDSTGIADTAFFGPEPEFFLFDDVRYDLLIIGGGISACVFASKYMKNNITKKVGLIEIGR